MKRNLVALSAIVLAIAVSSFTKKTVTQYFEYKGTSFTQSNVNSYNQLGSQPTQISGTGILNWIKVTEDDGDVTQSEFTTIFNGYDTNNNSSLSDETVIVGSLDRKNP